MSLSWIDSCRPSDATMPRSIQELQKRVFELQKQNRCQAVKIWHLEEEKMDLVGKLREVESLSRRKEAESNQGRRVCFGGVHFSDNTKETEEGGNNDASDDSVEEIEITLQEREIPGQKIVFTVQTTFMANNSQVVFRF